MLLMLLLSLVLRHAPGSPGARLSRSWRPSQVVVVVVVVVVVAAVSAHSEWRSIACAHCCCCHVVVVVVVVVPVANRIEDMESDRGK